MTSFIGVLALAVIAVLSGAPEWLLGPNILIAVGALIVVQLFRLKRRFEREN